jgi:hypothetical protein
MRFKSADSPINPHSGQFKAVGKIEANNEEDAMPFD